MNKLDIILLIASWSAVGLACLISAYSEKLAFLFYYYPLYRWLKFRGRRRNLRKGYFRKTRRPEPDNCFDQQLFV